MAHRHVVMAARGAFAAALAVGTLVFKKNLIRAMMEKQMSLPEPLWGRLLLSSST